MGKVGSGRVVRFVKIDGDETSLVRKNFSRFREVQVYHAAEGGGRGKNSSFVYLLLEV